MIGAGEMGDGRRSVVVKVISSVFPSGIQTYVVPTVIAMIGRQSALSGDTVYRPQRLSH
jgi:hypothetical protein